MYSKTIATVGICLACLLATAPASGFSPLQSGSRSSAGSSAGSSASNFAGSFGGSSTRAAAPINTAPTGNFSTSGLSTNNFDTSINTGPHSYTSTQSFATVEQVPSEPYAQSNNAVFQTAPAANGINGNNVWAINDPYSQISIDHSIWDHFLSRYVVTDSQGLNRVDYGNVSAADRQLLSNYLTQLQSVDTRTLNKTEQLAYWLNLYNSRTVSIVLDNYPTRSIRKIKTDLFDFVGPFDDDVLTVMGQQLSLTTIESGILRSLWKDPRIHYALNCASYGCPNLSKTAWSPFNIESRLDQAAYEFLNSGRGIKTQLFGTRVVASKIFKWYKEDFGGTDQQVLDHIRQYASPELRNQLSGFNKINGFFYDWSLNDAKVKHPRLFESFRL